MDEQTASILEDLRTLQRDTAENARKLAVHEAECSGRYHDLRRDVSEMVHQLHLLQRWMYVLCAAMALVEVYKVSGQDVVMRLLSLVIH